MKQHKFIDKDHAYSIARGYTKALDIEQYYQAWQYLYDHSVSLREPDKLYLEKLICDGVILTPENSEELEGRPYRGANPYGMISNLQEGE